MGTGCVRKCMFIRSKSIDVDFNAFSFKYSPLRNVSRVQMMYVYLVKQV